MADPREVLTRSVRAPTTTVRYGDGPDHVADLWLPADPGVEPLPLVVVIHGGFWRSGYDRSIAAPMSVALADEGFVAAAIEYRRTGGCGSSAGGWPMTGDDVRAAVERVGALVTESTGVALGRTVLIGHSAGGHLAVWAGSKAHVPGLSGVISLGGVVDLGTAAELRLGSQGDDGAVAALLGGSPAARPESYAAADPMRLPAPAVPVVLIHGDQDEVVPVELSRRYAAYARTQGAEVTLHDLPGVEHFGPIDPLSSTWPLVLLAVREASERWSG